MGAALWDAVTGDAARVAVAWAAAALVLQGRWAGWGLWRVLARSVAVAAVSCFGAGWIALTIGEHGALGAVCMGLFAWPMLSLFRDDAAAGAVLAVAFAVLCWLFWWIA